jgi:hypothetical protein
MWTKVMVYFGELEKICFDNCLILHCRSKTELGSAEEQPTRDSFDVGKKLGKHLFVCPF